MCLYKPVKVTDNGYESSLLQNLSMYRKLRVHNVLQYRPPDIMPERKTILRKGKQDKYCVIIAIYFKTLNKLSILSNYQQILPHGCGWGYTVYDLGLVGSDEFKQG